MPTASRPQGQKPSNLGIVAIVMITVILSSLVILLILGTIFAWPWINLRGVTLYNWLQLLIIPAVLAGGGFWLNQIQKEREERAAERRLQREQQAAERRFKDEQNIARDNQREAALQAYIDKMSELLFDKGLRHSQPENEVRSIAHVRTLTVLLQLDVFRKGTVLQFLHASGLIENGQPIIDLDRAFLKDIWLEEANLSHANLTHMHLPGAFLRSANLSKANLSKSDLGGAFLRSTNLHEADLCESDLNGATLQNADLSESALRGADLREANLGGTILRGADLRGADLRGALLSGAKYIESGLNGNDLNDGFYDSISDADRNGADPRKVLEADLSGADLSGVNLKNSFVTAEQLAQAKSLQGATLPDGTVHPS